MPMIAFCSAFLFTSCDDFLAETTYDFYDEQPVGGINLVHT